MINGLLTEGRTVLKLNLKKQTKMAYSSRHRYKSRREKIISSNRKLKMFFIFLLIAGVVYAYRNRVYIYDRISLWFY